MRGSVMSVALAFLLLITACAPERPVILHQLDVDCGYPPCKMFGLEIREEATLYAPFVGRVEVLLWDSECVDRTRNLPPGKKFVEIRLWGEGESLTLFLGEASVDVVPFVLDSDFVDRGTALSKVVGLGPSHWIYVHHRFAGFPRISFQVVGDWVTSFGRPVKVDEKKAESFLKGRSR